MSAYLSTGTILTPESSFTNSAIEIENGMIQRILPRGEIPDGNQEIYSFSKDHIATPGLIDIHVHGSDDADSMDSGYKSLNILSNFFAQHGVTSFYATTLTASNEAILESLDSIAIHKNSLNGANLLGAHLEGPYINPNYKGAQSPNFIRPINPMEYEQWFKSGEVKLITIAPEIEDSQILIDYGLRHGAEFAIGHSGASFEQVIKAADSGVRQATHTFNGMGKIDHREPGTAGGILYDDRIFAQIIADGIHVHPATVNLLVRIKGIEKTILITDAIQATGVNDGDYRLGDMYIHVAKGVARTSSGSLAGSTLTLDQAVRNMMEFAEVDFQSSVRMATSVPALAMNISAYKGNIQPGADADITVFDPHYQVVATMVRGNWVFQK